MRVLIAAMLLALAACGQGLPPPAQPSYLSTDTAVAPSPDITFLERAAMFENYQIQAGELAQAQAERQDVKDYGAALVTEHRATLATLTQLAQTSHMETPRDDLDDDFNAYVEMLHRQSGPAFDTIFASQQALAFLNAANSYDTYVKTPGDNQLKQWARTQAPKMHQGIDTARALATAH